MLQRIISSLFPTYCHDCNRRGTFACTACLATLQPSTPPGKDRFAVWYYRQPLVRELVRRLKNKPDRTLAKQVAPYMTNLLIAELDNLILLGAWHNPVVVPVPLHTSRLRKRGHNQSLLLARCVAKKLELPLFPRALSRIHAGTKQALSESKSKRLENMRGMFSVRNPKQIQDRTVIIVDDVTTTGATLNEIERILLAAGARNCIALTIAH